MTWRNKKITVTQTTGDLYLYNIIIIRVLYSYMYHIYIYIMYDYMVLRYNCMSVYVPIIGIFWYDVTLLHSAVIWLIARSVRRRRVSYSRALRYYNIFTRFMTIDTHPVYKPRRWSVIFFIIIITSRTLYIHCKVWPPPLVYNISTDLCTGSKFTEMAFRGSQYYSLYVRSYWQNRKIFNIHRYSYYVLY